MKELSAIPLDQLEKALDDALSLLHDKHPGAIWEMLMLERLLRVKELLG